MTRIVHVTRTIDTTESVVPTGAVGLDPATNIIADFQATMTQLKCASSERLVRLGVSMAQMHILFTLRRNGEMTMSGLADVLGVSLSNGTGLIDRLEERGYIERDRVATDRRIVLVRVTAAGELMLEEVDALSDALLRSVLERLPASQLKGVAHAISALREAVESTIGPMPNRHLASTPAPRSGPTMRGDDLVTHHGRI
jgi:DNA-binding MarR family transcriptional regulator